MKIHRFIVNISLKQGSLKLEDPELVNQIRAVLKLRPGEEIILSDGRGGEVAAEIKSFGKDSMEVEAGPVVPNMNEADVRVVVYCALLKKENFETVVQKVTEVGVAEIIPVITGRTVKLNVRKDRLEKIIREAVEQSGRGMLPVIAEPINFEDAVRSGSGHLNLFFDMSGEILKTRERLGDSKDIHVWIGPEGGWTPEEVSMVRNSGFKIVNLGKTTLRAETAAIIASYIAIHNK